MMDEYRRMEKAIRYIEEHTGEQPELEEIARHVELSPYHFQRLFKRWAGVSPKRYLQFLTVEDAKSHLRRSASVMETAYDVGLSGPGRLHDLFVSMEAVTPGQFKTRGEGLVFTYGFHDTPFGRALVSMTGEGITDLRFTQEGEEGRVLAELEEVWTAAEFRQCQEATGRVMDRVFRGGIDGAGENRIRLRVRGTNFQIKVWQALLRVPQGALVSYADVARAVGRPDAVRAVAGAVAANPVAWLIPCHRVLRSSGEIGGYRWGTARKKIMLTRELAGLGDR